MKLRIWETRKTFYSDDDRWLEFKDRLNADGVLIMSQAFYDALIPEWKETLLSQHD